MIISTKILFGIAIVYAISVIFRLDFFNRLKIETQFENVLPP